MRFSVLPPGHASCGRGGKQPRHVGNSGKSMSTLGPGKSREELQAEVEILRARLAALESRVRPASGTGDSAKSKTGDPNRSGKLRSSLRLARSAVDSLRRSDERFHACLENMLDCFGILSSV